MPDFAHQSEMTDACVVPRFSLSQTVVGMAHFAGTGALGDTCGGCHYWQKWGNRKQPICEKYREMTGDHAKSIPAGTASCRYWKAAQK